MKKFFTLLLITLCIGSTAFAQKEDTPYLTKSLSKENVESVFSRTSGGSILVAGVGTDARVEVYITSNNGKTLSKEEIKARLEKDFKLTVEVSSGKLTATAEPDSFFKDWKQGLNISFKIYVPTKVSTDLSTSGGSIDLENLAGTQNFNTSGGGLTLSGLSGRVRGKTSGGGIRIKDSKDDIDLATSGGSIHASNCSGTLQLNTSGGRIELDNLNGEIEAETSGGPIKGESVRGNLYARTSGGRIELMKMACALDASTSGGGINVEIVEVTGAVSLSNSGGNINLTMPANKGLNLRLRGEKINTVSLTNFSGEQEENRVTGKVNGGGVEVNVSTSGSITFSMK